MSKIYQKSLVIGAGSIGLRHIEVLNDIGQKTAVVTKRNDLKLYKYNDTKSALYNFNPDYIIIANETNKHISELQKILDCGYKNKILIEKPISNNLEEKKLLNVSNKHIYVGYNLRYHPFIKFIKKLMKKENVLTVNIYVGQFLPDWRPKRKYNKTYSSNKQKGGGVLLELSHEIDYMLLLFGKCLDNYSFSSKLSDLEINCDDSYVGIFKFEHCKQISCNFNLIDKKGRREILINTTNNSYKFDFVNNALTTNKNTEIFEFNKNDTYKNMHLDILNNNGRLACDFKEGWKVLKFINKMTYF